MFIKSTQVKRPLLLAVSLVAMLSDVHAMEVAKLPNGAKLDVGGFLTARFGHLDPSQPFAASEDAPAGFVVATEAGVNTQYLSSDGKLEGNIQFRARSGSGTIYRNTSDIYVTGAYVTWKPIETMRVDVGKIISRSWQERTIHLDNFVTYRPIPGAPGEYAWYPESDDGFDLSFSPKVSSDIFVEYGVFFSQNPLSNGGDGELVPQVGWNSGNPFNSGVAGAVPKAQTWLGHLEVRADTWHFIALVASEELELSNDSWGTSETSTTVGGNVNVKFWYDKDSDSFVKFNANLVDYDEFDSQANYYGTAASLPATLTGLGLNPTGADAEAQLGTSFQIQQGVTDNYWVYFEYSQTDNIQGIEDFESTWARVGVKRTIGDGGRISFDIERNQWEGFGAGSDPDASTFFGISFFQGF